MMPVAIDQPAWGPDRVRAGGVPAVDIAGNATSAIIGRTAAAAIRSFSVLVCDVLITVSDDDACYF